jgi:riboflavin kinase/FMN adenylyltransferase
MQVHFGLGALRAEWTRAVTCVGTFDGVHLGHQAVIRVATGEAAEKRLPCVLVTFDRHPNVVLAPDKVPPSLSTVDQNLEVLASLGVAVAVVLPFDLELSQCPASVFLQEILVHRMKAIEVVVGHDFALGHNREGNAHWLASRIATKVVPPFESDGRRVSSSAIRQLVQEGRVTEACRLLGRPYELSGVVVQGQRLGREIGYPTANLARSSDQVLPSDGIYSGRFSYGGHSYVAAVSIGLRPAAGGGARTVEAHLLDYHGGEIYGQPCRLALIERIREERDFPSLESLAEQIGRDVQQVRSSVTSNKM